MQPTSAAIAEQRAEVLVVDDSPENVALLASVLKEQGYRVRAAPDGELALASVEAHAPDLVLLDVDLPGLDGYAVCRALKERPALRGVPVIFLSALSETADKVKAFSAGGVDYVTKPFRVEEVTARVATHLAVRRLQREAEARTSELEKSYARLQELERVRQTLTQMIVHDLKNLLVASSASANYLREALGEAGELSAAAEEVCTLDHLMTRMVLDVLDVTMSPESGLTPRPEPVDIRRLLDRVVREFRGLVRASAMDAQVEIDPALGSVCADPDLLRRVVENLFENAIKYAPASSTVFLRALRSPGDGRRFLVRVEDQGPGVPPEEQEAIFEPYHRLQRDAGRKARVSRGLGLAFCRIAVRAMGGRVGVGEAAPGWSAFEVELPVDP